MWVNAFYKDFNFPDALRHILCPFVSAQSLQWVEVKNLLYLGFQD